MVGQMHLSQTWPRLLALGLVFVWFGSNLTAANAVDFLYSGPDCSLLYRFTPNTGTLNDLRVMYNGSFEFLPSNFGGITSFTLAGRTLRPWEGYHTSELLWDKSSKGVYTAAFRWSYDGDSLEFTIKMWIDGKTLVLEFVSHSDKVLEFGMDRSEETPDPQVIELPYGHNVLYTQGIFVSAVIDPFLSNASELFPWNFEYSNTSKYYSYNAMYNHLTDGSRNSLRERVYITVSPEIQETFFQVPNPVSSYRGLLSDQVVVDLWRGAFAEYRDELQTLIDAGMKDLFVLVHVWQKYGYDNGLPSTFPANPQFGGDSGLMEVVNLCEANGYLYALHTNYVDFYENSDVWNPTDIALNPDGTWVEAWYNPSTGMQSYLMKPSRVSHYAGLYEPDISSSYKTNAAFLDVHSAVLPSHKVDYDSSVAGAGEQRATFSHYRDLISYVRSVHKGPVAGEGFGFSTHIWAGYIDAVEADPRSFYDAEYGRGGTDVPTIVDYKLLVLHNLFVPHGVGYLERFYSGRHSDFTTEELDRYRATEIAFGNAGFLSNPFARGIPLAESLREYCFLKHLQRYFFSESPKAIYYFVNDSFVTLSEALRSVLPAISGDGLQEVLSEELGIVRIDYSNDFEVYVNRTLSQSLELTIGGINYRLPPSGFLAKKGDEFLAYSAEINGERVDYICPGELVCTSCPPFSLYLPLTVREAE